MSRTAHPRYVFAAGAVAAALLAFSPAPAAAQGQPAQGGAGGISESARYRADLEVRLSQIESQIAAITGRNEELSHALSQLTQKLDKLQAEIEQLQHPQGAAAGGAQDQGGPPTPAPAPQASTAPPPPEGGEGSEGIAHPGPGAPPHPLGSIPPGAVPKGAPPPQPAPSQSAALPPGSPKQQYEYALNFLRQQDFPKAETAFKEFLAAHPKDRLADNAQYWLGETYYVRADYQKAAFAFAEAIEKYPKGSKAPDSLLKLGMSLARLHKTAQACTAFARLKENFPKASTTVKRRADSEQQRLKCGS